MTHKKLSQRISELLDIQSFTVQEVEKIIEWKMDYTADEIIEALMKAVSFNAKRPLTDYTSKILKENRINPNEVKLPKYYQEEKDFKRNKVIIQSLSEAKAYYEKRLNTTSNSIERTRITLRLEGIEKKRSLLENDIRIYEEKYA